MSSSPGLIHLNLTAIDSETSHLLEEAHGHVDICEACRPVSGYPCTAIGYSDVRRILPDIRLFRYCRIFGYPDTFGEGTKGTVQAELKGPWVSVVQLGCEL